MPLDIFRYLLQKCVECRCRREIVTKSVDNFQVRVLTVDEGSNIELRPARPCLKFFGALSLHRRDDHNEIIAEIRAFR